MVWWRWIVSSNAFQPSLLLSIAYSCNVRSIEAGYKDIPTSIVLKTFNVAPHITFNGASMSFTSLFSFKNSSAVVAYPIQSSFLPAPFSLFNLVMIGAVTSPRSSESPGTWLRDVALELPEARGEVEVD